jgi:perosamine synthetase
MVSYSRQSINANDIHAVSDTLASDWLTTGPKVREFEERFAQFVGAKYAVAVNSGTAALHIAYLAAGLKPGDEVITTPITFCATANAALYCSAHPVFADIIDDGSGLIDPLVVKRHITARTRIIAPVHYAGQPCDLAELRAAAPGIMIVDDASHALGARYRDGTIGAGSADMTTFSFHPVKHITTGEGGMVTTNRPDLYQKLLLYRAHGVGLKGPEDQPWLRYMEALGYNYRITDFQCALGISQLDRFTVQQKRRMRLVERYDEAFAELNAVSPATQRPHRTNAYHLYVIQLSDVHSRRALYEMLKRKDILCQVHYVPVYRHPYYSSLGFKPSLCPRAELFYDRILSLPLYPDLTEHEQNQVINAIVGFFDS